MQYALYALVYFVKRRHVKWTRQKFAPKRKASAEIQTHTFLLISLLRDNTQIDSVIHAKRNLALKTCSKLLK